MAETLKGWAAIAHRRIELTTALETCASVPSVVDRPARADFVADSQRCARLWQAAGRWVKRRVQPEPAGRYSRQCPWLPLRARRCTWACWWDLSPAEKRQPGSVSSSATTDRHGRWRDRSYNA